MKKLLCIILSVLMAVTVAVPGFAVGYDKEAIASGDFSNLSYEQIASLVFDFIDRKIAEATADFDNFEAEVYGQEVQIPVEITGIDSLLQYKDHLTELGGDFANLDTSALNKTRADGDISLMYSFFEFIAVNSDVLGKVFGWTEENRFDYGKVGEYIEALDESDESSKAIKDFYHNYLLGNDIQQKFISEIAKEMNYTVADGEDFDTVINNGILNKVTDLCDGFLSDEAVEEIRGYNLKTTDIYTLIKDFCTLVQTDRQEDITMYYTYILDNLIRPVLKVSFGYTATVGGAAAVPEDFTSVYTDLNALEKLSGGKVQYRANDGSYYEITIKNGAVTGANTVSYGESFINLEAPEVKIGDKNTVIGTYTPTNPDISAYNPTVYTDASYAEYIDNDVLAAAGEFGVKIKTEDIPEAIAAITADGGTVMADEFRIDVSSPISQTIEISFEDIEALANEALSENLPKIQSEVVNPAVEAAVSAANSLKTSMGTLGSFLPDFTGSVTINSVTVKLKYTGYAAEDTFVCEVSVDSAYDITYSGNVWDYAQYAGITKDKIQSDYIAPAVEAAIKNPVATIVVDNLNGSVDGLEDVVNLMNFFDTDFAVDYGVLDFAGNYDTYNGVIGQANRVLCDALKMFLSDSGYESLGLIEGGNSNLTDNLEKLCQKADSLISLAKNYMDEAQFDEFTQGLSPLFVSSRGFNANMIYNMDFSSVENLYVCALRLGCDMFIEDNSGILYDIHEIIEDLDTLDSMLVGITEYAFAKVIDKLNTDIDGFDYKFISKTEKELKALDTVKKADPAKEVIMTDLADLIYYTAEFAVPKVNDIVNSLIDSINGESGDLPHIKFRLNVQKGEKWEETLMALTDRFLGLFGRLLICSDEASAKTDIIEKFSVILSAVLPMNSLLSNYKGLPQAVKYIFHDACAGDFEGILSYFDVKADTIAGDASVTKALINASDYIVDAFFPDTVEAQLYAQSETVQEEFTGELSDISIASRNMKAVNARKENVLACFFELLKESGTILPYLAGVTVCEEHVFGQWTVVEKADCEKSGMQERECSACGYKETQIIKPTGHKFGEYAVTEAASCTSDGTETRICEHCGKTETRVIPATGHSYGEWFTTKHPTCVEEGIKTSVCSKCGDTKTERIPATAVHNDSDGNGTCDICGCELGGKQPTVWEKIVNFFVGIYNWFIGLFN